MISSHISITNRAEQLSLYFYNGTLSNCLDSSHAALKPAVMAIETQIFSRIAGLLISPAAILELSFNLAALPLATIFCIGHSIYLRNCDFTHVKYHIQRIRDAVFPIFFGSLFGLIHPYLGTYAAEPTKKHIAGGILLSGTNKDEFDTVCSPVTTFKELKSLNGMFSPLEKTLLDDVLY